jgi:hypothetical protein
VTGGTRPHATDARRAADYTDTMASVRSSLALLAALAALLGAPAAAQAAAPTNTTAAAPAGWRTAPYAVEVSGEDVDGGPLTAEWIIDSTSSSATAPVTVAISDDGIHSFETRVVDEDSNDSGWRVETVRVDTTIPADTTDPGPTTWHGSVTSVTLTGVDATSGIDHMEWELDGSPTQSGPEGTVVGINGDGVHTLRTRAIDVAGNTSLWRTHTIRVDTVNPTDVTAAPSGWQTAPLAVTVDGADADSGIRDVTWRYQGGASTTVPAPATVNVSADGVHVLETLVTDNAGRSSGWKSHTIRIDKTGPDNQTPLAPTAWQAANYAVPVSGADSLSGVREVQWRVDGGAITTGASGLQATVTGSGDHLFETRVVDNAGNSSAWRAEHVRIDSLPPANTTPTPTSPEDNPYTVAITGTDAHSSITAVKWRVDGGPVQAGAPGATVTVTGNGAHTLETLVLDAAGNDSGWRTDSFTIDAVTGDATPPVDTTTTVSSAWRVSDVAISVSATDSGSGVDRVEWRIDGQPIQTGPSTFTISDEGVHELETRAFDVAGNGTSWRLQTIRIDKTVPTDTTAIPSGWHDSRTFRLGATDAQSGVADIEYTINGGPVRHGQPDELVDVGADGTYVVRRRVIDAAGQASNYKTDTLKVDTADPVDTTTLPGSAWSAVALEVPLSGTDDASGVTMEWRLDGGDTQAGDTAVVGADGEQLLEVRARDGAGNTTAWQGATVRVDTSAPVNDTTAVSSAWRRTAYPVELEGSDAGSGVDRIEHTLDGGAVSLATSLTVTGDGLHTLRSRVVDAVGHASAWRTDTIRIDSAAPTAGLACGTSGWRRSAAVCTPTAAGGPSGLASLRLSRNGGAPTTVTAGAPLTLAADGVHALRLLAADGAGNTASATATVRVDRTAPVATLACVGSYTCRAIASDAASGLAAVAYSLDGGAWRAVAADGSFAVAHGSVRLRAADVAGNVRVTAPVALPDRTTAAPASSTAPVHLAGRSNVASLIGALQAARAENGTVSVDLRPLAVGRGRFRVDLRVKAGGRSRRVARTYKVGRLGTLPRIQAKLDGATARTTVTLTVKRRAGKRWRRHATARVVLGGGR